jgi:hypothetical protein
MTAGPLIGLLVFTAAPSRKGRPKVFDAVVEIHAGRSIAGMVPGMKRQAIAALGIQLGPEGVDRAARTGWISGPLLVLCDNQERVVLVSVELRKSKGLRVDGIEISRRAKLEEIAKALPSCQASVGSGGNALSCRGPDGGELKFYDARGGDEVWVTIGGG